MVVLTQEEGLRGQDWCWSQAKHSLQLLEGAVDEDMLAETGARGPRLRWTLFREMQSRACW